MKTVFVALVMALSACAPSRKQLTADLAACRGENIALLNEIGEKNDRLARFNQLSDDKTLRPLKIWRGDVSAPVTGNESWQK